MATVTKTISVDSEEITRAKRAVVVLMECFKASHVEAPLDLKMDFQALMRVIRKVEN